MGEERGTYSVLVGKWTIEFTVPGSCTGSEYINQVILLHADITHLYTSKVGPS